MALDSDARKVLELMAAAKRPPLTSQTPQEARTGYRQARRALQPALPDVAELRDLASPSARGPIPLRFYRGRHAPATKAPALVYIHGGGWVVGDLDTHDYICRKLANDTDGVVIAIDYRLAPEHKFPTPVEECADAAKWIASQAADLGIDANRIAIGGDSAGGNLAAVLCLMSRDGDGPGYIFQALLYPGTDLGADYSGGVGADPALPLTNDLTNWFRDHYLRDEADRQDWRASPLRAKAHDDLPPAFVLTVRHDPLRGEGQAYVRKLEAAGVRVLHLDMNDQVHGFLTMGKIVRAADTVLEMCAAALRHAYSTAR